METAQPVGDPVGLPARQGAAAGADPDRVTPVGGVMLMSETVGSRPWVVGRATSSRLNATSPIAYGSSLRLAYKRPCQDDDDDTLPRPA